jgi:NagD protein
LDQLRNKKGYICDMDGVIYHGNRLLDGVHEFVSWLVRENKSYLFLTNSSERSPLELKQKLERLGLDVDESHFYTSAQATAKFLAAQSPGCSAYVIGAPGLLNALYSVGIAMNDVNPDYVVVGETKNYNYESILRAVTLVLAGARLIGTNPDMTGPTEAGLVPACRALIAPIELATGRSAYFVGKPNALMMRTGLQMLGVHSNEAVMIGDRMDTDIIAGIETGLTTALVLSGVTTREEINAFPYRPTYVLEGVGDMSRAQGAPDA